MTKKAVVLLSGGIDSSTTLSIAKVEGCEVYALSFDYGQKHKLELASAKSVAESLGVKKHLIIKFDLREIGGSALTSDVEVPKGWGLNSLPPPLTARTGKEACLPCYRLTQAEVEKSEIRNLKSPIPLTYVPARNTIFLSFALAWAEAIEVEDIFIGANAIDYSGYPDCRPEYLKAFEDMANLATKASVEGRLHFKINAPLLYMTKAEIIKRGIEAGVDYSLTWSCYDPQKSLESAKDHEYVPCSRCDSCLLRIKGFREAGIADPLFNRPGYSG